MDLARVEIKNYRSIQSIDLSFEPRCRILVGINESGKTNVLHALNLLDPKETPTPRDRREAGRNEAPITESFVRFSFNFSEEETASLIADIKENILAKDYSALLLHAKGQDFTLDRFCATRQGIYKTDLTSGKKVFSTWSVENPKLKDDWFKPSSKCPPDFTVVKDGDEFLVAEFDLVNSRDFPEIPADYLERPDVSKFIEQMSAIVRTKTQNVLPNVLLWNYDETMLLPPKIDLEQFCSKPDSCLPLRSMFQLYGTTDIAKEIASAKAAGTNGLRNYLAHVAEKATNHFHKTWKEYDEIGFSLTTDGPYLVAAIEDQSNCYEMVQRSDGFKRFVTFLLLVSAEKETNNLKDTLLLIDEPENGLHPSGARYLLAELIEIAKSNFVVFSTHSIFMIDNKTIDRHIIVKKRHEVTTIEKVSQANIQDEEVIFQALGHSIFSNLKEKNLLFEGWRDKRLFEVAISRVPADYEDVKKLKAFGRCFSHGVKQIKNITPLFEAGERKCLIVTDNDAPAKEQQRLYQQQGGYGIWATYHEILPDTEALTGEDFLRAGAFSEVLQELAAQFGVPPITADQLDAAGGRLKAIRRWLASNGVRQDDAESAIERIKAAVFDNLRHGEIAPCYYDYLQNVLNKSTEL